MILSLKADVSDHLRKVEDKSSLETIRNIDCIYVINLSERPERWIQTTMELSPYGISPCRLSAVNGWKLSLEEINDVGLHYSPEMEGGFMGTCYLLDGNFEPHHEIIQEFGRTYFCHCLSRGAIGIMLSHLSVLQDAFDAGYETIWVMEDDIQVIRDPRQLSSLIDELNTEVGEDGWDILFTDRDIHAPTGEYVPCYYAGRRPDYIQGSLINNYQHREQISPNFIKIGARSGAHSMILKRSGIEKILSFCKAHNIFFPYDMEYIFPPNIKLYTVESDIVTNRMNASSDNGGPTYFSP